MDRLIQLSFAEGLHLFGLALGLVGALGVMIGLGAGVFRATLTAVMGSRWREPTNPKGDPVVEALAWSTVALVLAGGLLCVSSIVAWVAP